MDREQQVGRAWQASTEFWPGAVARLIVLAIVLLTPWFDPRNGLAAWLWLPALVLLACWILTPELTAKKTLSLPLMVLVLVAAALFAFVQLVPLPQPLLASVSPLGAKWWGMVDAGFTNPEPTGPALASRQGANSISLYPWGGKLALAAIALGSIFLLAGARFFRSAIPFGWFSLALALTALLLAAGSMLPAEWRSYLWPPGVDSAPLFLIATAASLGLVYSKQPMAFVAGVIGCCASLFGFYMAHDASAPKIAVAFAGGAAVIGGLAASRLPARGLTIPLLLVVATAAPWVISQPWFDFPTGWKPFVAFGAGFGSLELLATDRPSDAPAPTGFVARLLVEGGWPAIALAALGFWIAASSLAKLARFDEREDMPFFVVGMFLLPTATAWLGYSDGLRSPYYLIVAAVVVGAVVGRAVLSVDASLTSTAFVLPRILPAPAFGALLLAASLWSASVAWTAQRSTAAAAAIDALKPTQRMQLDVVDEALLRLRPLVHPGDARALSKLAELRLDRFRIQTAAQLAKQMELSAPSAWRRSDPVEIFSRANSWKRAKQSAALDALRRETPVVENLDRAFGEWKDALTASPLAAHVVLRTAQLRFATETPVHPEAMLDLAAERASPTDANLLYEIGLEEYFVGRIDRAARRWRDSLRLSLSKIAPVCYLLATRVPATEMLESVLPNHPEAYLTFAETLGAKEKNAVARVAALEFAKRSLDSAELPKADRQFHQGRWHAGVNEIDMAIKALRAAVKESPRQARYRQALASALEVKGDKLAAFVEVKSAQAIDPTDPVLETMAKRLQPLVDPTQVPRLLGPAGGRGREAPPSRESTPRG